MKAPWRVLLIWVFCAGAWAADPPAVAITVGDSREIVAPRGSATAGSTWIEFDTTYRNLSKKSIWIDGYSPNHVFCDLETRSDDKDKWVSYGLMYCGTGASRHKIPPDVSHRFKVALPEKYRASEFRVVIDYFESAKSTTSKRAVSGASKVTAARKAIH